MLLWDRLPAVLFVIQLYLPLLEAKNAKSTHAPSFMTPRQLSRRKLEAAASHSYGASNGTSLPSGRALHADVACETPTHALITGISGMIGSHVARVLVAKPCTRVFGLVRPRSDLSALHGVLSRIELVLGDIADEFRMREVIHRVRPHYLYHFAAQAINGISYGMPGLSLDVNVRGTLNLIEPLREVQASGGWRRHSWRRHTGQRNESSGGSATKAQLPRSSCRVLIAGSSTEYGKTADLHNGPIPESAPLLPVSPYGVSKVATESLARQYFLAHGVQVVVARFFIQVGVGGTDSLAIHQFCKQIALAEAGLGPRTLMHGNLESYRDMTDSYDAAPVVVSLLERGALGEAYNVGSGNPMSMAALLQTALSLARVPIEARADPSRLRPYDEKVLSADNTKLRALTGWVPSTNMTFTVAKILEYWRRKVEVLYAKDEYSK